MLASPEFFIEKNEYLQRRIINEYGHASEWFNRDQIAYTVSMGKTYIAVPSNWGSLRVDLVYELLDENQ